MRRRTLCSALLVIVLVLIQSASPVMPAEPAKLGIGLGLTGPLAFLSQQYLKGLRAAAGLNAEETERLRALVVTLRGRGTTILVIEHDMRFVMGLCDGIVVLNHGEKIAEGTPREIVQDARVVEAYLGTADGASRA